MAFDTEKYLQMKEMSGTYFEIRIQGVFWAKAAICSVAS